VSFTSSYFAYVVTTSIQYDESDPHDRRKSQFLMKERLDELERVRSACRPWQIKSAHAVVTEPSAIFSSEVKTRVRDVHGSSDAPSLVFFPNTAVPLAFSVQPRRSYYSVRVSLYQYYLACVYNTSYLQWFCRPPLEAARWPAVPYSHLNGDSDDPDLSVGADDFPSPPKFALNGVSNAIPLSPYKSSFSDSNSESEESKARRREHDEGQEPSYPAIIPPSLRKKPKTPEAAADADAQVIPLSPDPFGRFPSEMIPPVPPVPPVPALPSRMSQGSHRSSSSQSRPSFSFDAVPEGAGLERDDSMSSVSEKASTKLSSRFSLDSEDAHAQRGATQLVGTSALNPVKSIRTLWRKSRKASLSGTQPPAPGPVPRVPSINGGQVQAQAGLAVPMPRVSEEVVTNAMLPPGRRGPSHPDAAAVVAGGASMTTAEMMRRARGEQDIGGVHFDQESPYPIRRPSASPRLPSAQMPPSPRLQDTQLPAPSPTPSPVPPEPADPKGSARKSILKAWAGSRTSVEDTPGNTPARKRRPSMLDMVRSSRAGETAPPSPMLPEQYARQSAGSSRSSGPHIATPAGGVDDAFELVEGAGGHGKAPSLSYPYHELDHQS
jgi:hypothetical protein